MAESSDEITPVVEPVLVVGTSGEMETEAYGTGEVKAMKDHIDLESSLPKKPPPMDLKEIAGSFRLAASVFSKKWHKWRRNQKLKKEEAAGSKAAAAAMPQSEKPSKPSFLRRSRLRGEAGSEFAGGRRSCDTDPRFSLDAGRMSVDDVGLSWDGPRASWDGYLFGAGAGIGLGRAPPPVSRLPPLLSALEGSPARAAVPSLPVYEYVLAVGDIVVGGEERPAMTGEREACDDGEERPATREGIWEGGGDLGSEWVRLASAICTEKR
ncbi:hypothetical protein TRIUR3_33010 [Triticum urartu]|uniref:Uncharacterized protein n=1 Tax=Triticum urartu TaxID=4572 RepID=M7YY15_TRIUA|nr:hypothetical protein TRIUR3_33010 [Triticum urartu]